MEQEKKRKQQRTQAKKPEAERTEAKKEKDPSTAASGGPPPLKSGEVTAEEKKAKAQAKKRNKLVKGGKLGRPKKLTPEELRRGVEAYFASISYQEPVTREEYVVLDRDPETGAVTFQVDKMGHRMVRQVPVLDANGKTLVRTVYVEAPGDFGLCNFLKISRDTWDRYGHLLESLEAAGNRQQATGDGGDGGPMWSYIRDSSSSAPTESAAPTEEELREARDFAEIYTLARGRICAYLESAAESRGGKGAQFKMERIYGLTEKKDVRLDAGGSIEAYLRGLED